MLVTSGTGYQCLKVAPLCCLLVVVGPPLPIVTYIFNDTYFSVLPISQCYLLLNAIQW